MVAVRLTPPFPFVVVGSPDYLQPAEAAGAHRRSARPRLPAHAPLERVDRALALCRRQQDGRGDRLRAAHRARLPHAARSGDPRRGTCAGARPARQSADCRRPIASAPDALRRHNAGVFLYYPDRRQVLPKLRAFIEHVKYRSRQRSARRNDCADIAQDRWREWLLRTVIRPDQRLSTTFRRPCGSSRPQRIEIAGVSRSASAPSRQASPDATSRSTRPAAFSRQGWKSPLRAAPRASIPPRTLDRRPRSGPLEMGA